MINILLKYERTDGSIEVGHINYSPLLQRTREGTEAMYLMMQSDKPDDYIIATGITNSLKDFVSMAFKKFNLDESKYVICDESLLRPSDIKYSFLNPSKIFKELNWKSKKNLESIIDSMFEDFIKQGFEE